MNARLPGVAFAVLVTLTLALPARAGDPSLPEVTVDLSTRATGAVLPIETEFFLTGTVPTTIKKIEVRYEECPRRGQCQEVEFDDKGCVKTAASGKGPFVWRPTITTVPAAANANAVPFRIRIPELEANHFYRFRFDVTGTVDQPIITTFVQNARTAVEGYLDRVAQDLADMQSNANADASVQKFFPNLRTQLLAELNAIKPACSTVIAVPNTPLDPAAEWAVVQTSFRNPLLKAAGADLTFLRGLQAASSGVRPLQEQLTPVVKSPLRRLFAAIQAKPQNDPLRAEIAEFTGAIALTKLADLEISEVANGAEPMLPQHKETLLTSHSTTEIAARTVAYRNTALFLQDLGELVQRLNANGTIKSILADQVDRDAVAALISGGYWDRAATAAQQQFVLLTNLGTFDKARTDSRGKSLDDFTSKLSLAANSAVDVGSSTLGDYLTFANRYITADAGFLFAPEPRKTVPYIGVNFYTIPMNKDVTLTQVSSFRRRTSFTVALTATSIADSKKRSDLFASQSLVLGAGYRITDIFRVAGGGVVFNRKDPNPLISREKISVTPYISISFDFNLAKAFPNIGKLFGGTT